MTIKEIRSAMGLTQRAFAKKYEISLRAVESWEQGQRKCPEIIKMFLMKELAESAKE